MALPLSQAIHPLAASEKKSLAKPKSNWDKTAFRISEASIWIIVIAVLIAVRLLPNKIFDDESTFWLAGLIIAFALTYYIFIYRFFTAQQRHYIKDIADVLFIGILGTLARDYSVYFFTLYILPIAAAAFALDILNSLVVATFASLFIAGNLVLNTQFFAAAEPIYFGTFQIVFLVLVTFFTRTLALQLRSEHQERSFFETKLRQADKKLQDVEALEREFVSITSHQLNTPLSIIRGYSSMLLGGDAGKLSTKQKKYIRYINSGSLRLIKLVRDLLDITHIEEGQLGSKERISLNLAISQSTEPLEDKALSHNIKLQINKPKQPLYLKGNFMQLAQAFTNIIDNAIKYSEPGNQVSVELRADHSIKSAPAALLIIQDAGIGIPKDEQERIFQRFYRASNTIARDANGNGLGLYISKQIIEAHDGSISFTSEPSQGTTFKIRLPLVR